MSNVIFFVFIVSNLRSFQFFTLELISFFILGHFSIG